MKYFCHSYHLLLLLEVLSFAEYFEARFVFYFFLSQEEPLGSR